jgi:hypothetical protein
MALTFKDLQDEVLNHGFDETYRPRVKNWLNEAQQRFARSTRSPDFTAVSNIATTTNEPLLAIPSDFVRVLMVTLPDYQDELLTVSLKRIELQPSRAGKPGAYSIDEAYDALRLYPIPDGVYNVRVRYLSKPVDLVNDADISLVPSAYQDLLTTYALSRAFRSEDDYEAAGFFYNQWITDLQRASTDLQYRDTTNLQVTGTWDY